MKKAITKAAIGKDEAVGPRFFEIKFIINYIEYLVIEIDTFCLMSVLSQSIPYARYLNLICVT